MSMTTGGIGSLQPVTAETRGKLPARFKLGADTPSNPYNLEIARPAASARAMCTDLGRFWENGIPRSNPSNLIAQRPAASGMHTYEETRRSVRY